MQDIQTRAEIHVTERNMIAGVSSGVACCVGILRHRQYAGQVVKDIALTGGDIFTNQQ
jgi:hypothetical protein